MAKTDKKGRTQYEHFTKVFIRTLKSDAWRAMSPKAQMLHIWLQLEWKGPKNNNNGGIKLSYRQAAKRLGLGENTVMKAFHELQAKGFLVVTRLGALGVEGEARGPSYELTDIGLGRDRPRRLYLQWDPNNEFEVARHPANNPKGLRGK